WPNSPLPRLQEPAQQRPWTLQGRNKIPSQRHDRRSKSTFNVDDLEVRGCGHPIRWSQRRSDSQPQTTLSLGTRETVEIVLFLDQRDSWSLQRHSRTRRLHRLSDYGMVHG